MFIVNSDDHEGLHWGGGGGGSPKSVNVGGFGTPPFFENGPWGFFQGYFSKFRGDILLGYTSAVLSLPPMQPPLILSPLLQTPENVGVT